MPSPDPPSAESQPPAPQPPTSNNSDSQNGEHLPQKPDHQAQDPRPGSPGSPGSQKSREKSPVERPPSSPERGRESEREPEREPWIPRGPGEANASGYIPEDRRDREDPDPRYAPISNAPTQGQICRYVVESRSSLGRSPFWAPVLQVTDFEVPAQQLPYQYYSALAPFARRRNNM